MNRWPICLLPVLLLGVACAGCSGSRTVTLEEGLQQVKQGKYSLVIAADGMISFQVDYRHKYQYYGDEKHIADAVPLLKQALMVASNAGHTVVFTDGRRQESDTASRGLGTGNRAQR